MKKHAPKQQCPVSKKFYTYVSDRVRESLELIGREDAVADRYMADGTQPSADTDPAVRLAFALLCAEIDKAVLRSSRARSRVAKKSPVTSSLEPSAVPDAVRRAVRYLARRLASV